MLRIFRYKRSNTETLGVLIVDGHYFCDTLELPWRQNAQNISCIPLGIYPVESILSSRHGKCIAVSEVKGRSGILIHAGNTVADTEGCILVGVRHGNSVRESRNTLSKLLDVIKKDYMLIEDL